MLDHSGSGGIIQLKSDFWLAVKNRDLAVALPKLNVVAINKLLRLFRGLIVVDADQRNGFLKTAVLTDSVCAIFRHVAAPNGNGESITQLTVTECCQGQGGDALAY
jgi:hypothetical protein